MTIKTCENIVPLADILKKDRWSSCKLIAEWTGIPKTIVQQILRKDLQKQKLCTRFVLYALTAEQKEQRIRLTTLLKQSKATQNFWIL